MSGITLADAIPISTLILGVIAMLTGAIRGAEAKRSTPPDLPMAMIGSAIVDRETLRDLTTAVRETAAAIREAVSSGERRSRDETNERLEELTRKLDGMSNSGTPRGHRHG
jgi:hypothetical protein